MGDIVVSFQELLNCPPFWGVMVLGITLGVLEVLYADKCGFGMYCRVTFKYRILNAPKRADSLQLTMQMLSLVAITMPMFMLVLYEGYSGIFMLMWWALFLLISIVSQWALLVGTLLGIMFTETRRQTQMYKSFRKV